MVDHHEDTMALAIGALAIGVVAYLVLKGSYGSSSSTTFGQADPKSVAALYSANAADVAANDAASTANKQNILQYLGLKDTNATNLAENSSNNATTLATTQVTSGAAETIAGMQEQGAVAIAQQQAGATIAGAQYAASSATAIAQASAAAAEQVSANQTTSQISVANSQKSASNAASNSNTISSFFGAIAKIFGF